MHTLWQNRIDCNPFLDNEFCINYSFADVILALLFLFRCLLHCHCQEKCNTAAPASNDVEEASTAPEAMCTTEPNLYLSYDPTSKVVYIDTNALECSA